MKENQAASRPAAAEAAAIMQRAWAVVLAAVLCLGLMPATAWAEEGSATFSVALTVLDTTDPANGVLKNVKVDGMTSKDTVADLLAKAGFKAGDEAASKNDASGMTYFVSNNAPYFLGKGYDAATNNYWATIFDGGSDPEGWKSALLDANLIANGHYQYVYGSAYTFEYSDEALEFPVQLTVLDTTDPANGVLKNVKVDGMTSKDTVADLLAKAGFKAVTDVTETEGDDGAYADSYGSPVFRGNKSVQNPSGAWTYWATMFDGDSANFADAQIASKLKANGHYQYIYTSGSTFEYFDAVPQLVSAAVNNPLPTGSTPDPEPAPKPEPQPGMANAYDAEKASTLTSNLAARYAVGGSDASLNNDTVFAALALNALGKGDKIAVDALVENMNGYEAQYGYPLPAGAYAKYVMALSAAGLDCGVDNAAGKSLVADMESRISQAGMDVFAAVWVLPVYEYGSYNSGASAMSVSDLIDFILANRNGENLFGSADLNSYDTQTTAQAILALLPYREARSDVDEAIKAAEQALLAYQNEDGGFGYWASDRASNLDATANAVAALSALGHDASRGSDLTTASGSTPVGYLLSRADGNLAGYKTVSKNNESMTSATVLLALAASEGYQKSGTAFNVYKAQPVVAAGEGPEHQLAGTSDGSDEKALAKTSDGAAPYAAGVTAAALGALAAGIVATRKLRGTREPVARR